MEPDTQANSSSGSLPPSMVAAEDSQQLVDERDEFNREFQPAEPLSTSPRPLTLTECLQQKKDEDQQTVKKIEEGLETTHLQPWRDEWSQTHPGAPIPPGLEFSIREYALQLEAIKRGIRLGPQMQQGSSLSGSPLSSCVVKGFQDARQASSKKPPEIIKGLVLQHGPTLVSSHPHGMKSFSWLQASIEAPAMKTVWGHFAAPNVRNTLFIETEDPEWLVEQRIRQIARGIGFNENEPLPGFGYFCPGAFDLIKHVEELEGIIAKHKPDFAVISTLQNILGGKDWNDPAQMFDVNALIVRLSRTHCPIILITHSPWNKKQRRAAGSVTLTANFQTTLHYEKCSSTKTKQTTVHVAADSKVGAEDNFYLNLRVDPNALNEEPRAVHLTYGGKGRPKGSDKEAVLAAIEEDPDASPKEIAARVDVSDRYVKRIKEENAGKRKPGKHEIQKPVQNQS